MEIKAEQRVGTPSLQTGSNMDRYQVQDCLGHCYEQKRVVSFEIHMVEINPVKLQILDQLSNPR